MAERRFNEAEMKAIFENAADAEAAGRQASAASDGMTLAQLQEIGREAGISPEAVALAARLVEQRGQPVSQRWLGLPIGVGRTLELGRRLSEREWEDLVVDLRETFDARGHVSAQGSFREWRNGNLQALLEPTTTGQRLRIRTVKGGAQSLVLAGVAMAGAAVVMALVTVIPRGGTLGEALLGMAPLMAMAAGLVGAGALRLPSWARLRARQMDDVLARLARTTSEPAPDRLTPPNQ
jgi:hypothetical protein